MKWHFNSGECTGEKPQHITCSTLTSSVKIDQTKKSLPRNCFIPKHLFRATYKIKAKPQNKLHSQPEQMIPALTSKPRNGGRIQKNDSLNCTKQKMYGLLPTHQKGHMERVLELSYETHWVLFYLFQRVHFKHLLILIGY